MSSRSEGLESNPEVVCWSGSKFSAGGESEPGQGDGKAQKAESGFSEFDQSVSEWESRVI